MSSLDLDYIYLGKLTTITTSLYPVAEMVKVNTYGAKATPDEAIRPDSLIANNSETIP